MEPLPEFIVDDKDPLIYQKTIKYEQEQRDWDQKYLNLKLNTSYEQLTEGLPTQFLEYFNYLEKLPFEAKPDYAYLRQLFEQVFKDNNFVEDDQFDWILHKQKLLEERAKKEAEEKKLKEQALYNQVGAKVSKLDKQK